MGLIVGVGQRSYLARNWSSLSCLSDRIAFIAHDEIERLKTIEGISHVVSFMKDDGADSALVDEADSTEISLIKLLEDMKDVKYVCLSSRLIYGRSKFRVLDEDSPVDPDCYYAFNKYFVERYAHNALGERAAILRPGNVFGYEPDKDRKSFMGWLLRELSHSTTIAANCSRDEVRDFLPVSVFCYVLDQVVMKDLSGIYNVGSGSATKIGTMIETVCAAAEFGGQVTYQGPAEDSFVLNVDRLRSVIGEFITEADILKAAFSVGERAKLECRIA